MKRENLSIHDRLKLLETAVFGDEEESSAAKIALNDEYGPLGSDATEAQQNGDQQS